jgi:hypothetical protein
VRAAGRENSESKQSAAENLTPREVQARMEAAWGSK